MYTEDIDLTKKFPRRMLVSDIGGSWYGRTVLWIDPNPNAKYPVVTKNDLTPAKNYTTQTWDKAKEIEPVRKMTVAEIIDELGYDVEIVK